MKSIFYLVPVGFCYKVIYNSYFLPTGYNLAPFYLLCNGRRAMFMDGYRYSYRGTKHMIDFWRCTKHTSQKCGVEVRTVENIVIEIRRLHTHPPTELPLTGEGRRILRSRYREATKIKDEDSLSVIGLP